MPYYRITIKSKKRDKPYRGVRFMDIWNPDVAYRLVKSKAISYFGESDVIDVEVVMLPKGSKEVRDLIQGKR